MNRQYIEATTSSLEAFYNRSRSTLSKTQRIELENIIQQYKNCPPGITAAEGIQLASLLFNFMMAASGHNT
jgi:hypothetical protein